MSLFLTREIDSGSSIKAVKYLRFIVPEWISYKDSLNSCEWNFTLTGETEACQMEKNDPGDSGETPFYLSLGSGSVKRFSFDDIFSFKITFTVDPEGNLPNGKGDMPSAIVAYPHCKVVLWTDPQMCGPFKGT